MSEIRTAFGAFVVEPGDYAVHPSGDGASIRVLFVPGPGVDAACFGMIQVARNLIGGVPAFEHDAPSLRHRSIPDGEEGAGAHVDQDPWSRNPLYAVASQPAGIDDLGAGQIDPDYGALGCRYFRGDGGLHAESASLADVALLQGVSADCAQLFEITCVAVEGAQAGTYYGSVSWGWTKDTTGTLHLHPLELVSLRSPSAVVRRAVELWNRSSTPAGEPTLPLPLPTIDGW